MPISLPPTVKSLGNKVVIFLEDPPAALTGIPTTVEVNLALFAALHLYTPFNVTPTQNTGEGPRKLGARKVPTENGLVNYPAVDVQYSYLPQSLGTPGAVGNELYELLVPEVQRTAVVLDGLDGTISSVAVGAVCDVYLIEPGVRRKGQTGDGEFDHLSVTQSLIVVGGDLIVEDHKLAAA